MFSQLFSQLSSQLFEYLPLLWRLIDVVFTPMVWLLLGFVGAVIYTIPFWIFAGGPANPFADKDQRINFVIIVCSGALGLLIAIYSCFYVHKKRTPPPNNKEEKVWGQPEDTLW